jgi:hypothetical protein
MIMFDPAFDPIRLLLAVSSIAVAAFVVVSALRARRPVRALIAAAALMCVLGGIYVLTFPTTIGRTRGEAESGPLVVSYIAMVLGMMAHYVYAKAEKGETRLTIEWMRFVMPILASPIVFIPLVSIAGEVGATGHLFERAKVMVYLVAFQNGFFWKHFFDQRRPGATAPDAVVTGDMRIAS